MITKMMKMSMKMKREMMTYLVLLLVSVMKLVTGPQN